MTSLGSVIDSLYGQTYEDFISISSSPTIQGRESSDYDAPGTMDNKSTQTDLELLRHAWALHGQGIHFNAPYLAQARYRTAEEAEVQFLAPNL